MPRKKRVSLKRTCPQRSETDAMDLLNEEQANAAQQIDQGSHGKDDDNDLSVVAVANPETGFLVKGPSGPLVAPLGSSVILPCCVDEPLLMEGLEVQWKRTDSDTLVHLYQDGESRPESQHQDYHDRAHFFTDQIQHGNFSLRLDNLRAEDEGKYTCKVYSQQDSGERVVEIRNAERLVVSGSDKSISASVGEDVTLNCSVDSHITPEHIEEVSWKKTDEDGDILVLLYQNNETLSDSAHVRYRNRVEFFTAEIFKGNFSLRLKSVRTDDKGVYMCQVFAGGLSANATIVLERLVVLPCYVGTSLPKEGLKVEWRKTDSETLVHLYQDGESRPENQHQDYHDRAHFFTESMKHGNFSLHLDKMKAEDAGKYTCKVYSNQTSVFSAYVNVAVGFRVRGEFVPLGDSVVMPCSVGKSLLTEGLKVEWRRADSETLVHLHQIVILPCYVDKSLLKKNLKVEWRTDSGSLVHLYHDSEIRPEKQLQDYHDRAHFFTEEIQHGNFSLCLDNLRAEDEGQYTCTITNQQDSVEVLSTKTNLASRLDKCVALCDFTPEDDDELKLLKGETIEILKKSEGGWWKGKKNNQTGFFPTSYVKEIEPSKDKCVALYDFTPEDDDELKLLKGETIEILEKSGGEWWKGKKNNQTGVFPTSYVKEIEPSKADFNAK
ncbi:butyrophilin 2 [Labeo rohita]|uniref:Butyrophilin 2 n=1 Tax=Labeo rohita TaxID=84645 RepID=A0A498P1W0_LABRO|nr:butyrophilin 2 [Labeo rohita]